MLHFARAPSEWTTLSLSSCRLASPRLASVSNGNDIGNGWPYDCVRHPNDRNDRPEWIEKAIILFPKLLQSWIEIAFVWRAHYISVCLSSGTVRFPDSIRLPIGRPAMSRSAEKRSERRQLCTKAKLLLTNDHHRSGHERMSTRCVLAPSRCAHVALCAILKPSPTPAF